MQGALLTATRKGYLGREFLLSAVSLDAGPLAGLNTS